MSLRNQDASEYLQAHAFVSEASPALRSKPRVDVAEPDAHAFVSETSPVPPALVELVRLAGIAFNGTNPWDIRVQDPIVYDRILAAGSLGFGEAYMDGQWDAPALDETMTRLVEAKIGDRLKGLAGLRLILAALRSHLVNLQSPARAFHVGERHYDVGNAVYKAMLDPSMSYSCGYWEHAEDLNEAQVAKLEMICRKLDLQPGERVLDIGCGWGSLAEYAARTRGVEVLGVTVSREQVRLGQERCAGLPVEIRLQDYRDLKGQFDKVVSVGMFEHVGHKNYRIFFRRVASLLKDDGLFLLHTIGCRTRGSVNDPWVDKYIFPNGQLPNSDKLARAFNPHFILEDWHNFGQDYDRTLMAWWKNFDRHWPEIAAAGYDEQFYRMWKYYLHSFAGFFRSRMGQLWQIVLSQPGRRPVYRSVR